MSTITHKRSVSISLIARKNRNAKFWDMIEFNRFGIITAVFGIIGCCGGMAAGFGAQESLFQLTLVVMPTMLTLAITLAVAPMRYILVAACIALAADLLVFLI
jgi:phage shock protein PspC (stress-responsive transcriptional regulator)